MDKTVKTIEGYNRCAGEFVAKHMDLGIYEQFVREFSNCLKEGSTILDLGCGPGNIVKFLVNQDKGYKILGVDLSPKMLKIARQNVPTEQFIIGDIRHLQMERKFDAVIVSFCMIHLNDDEAIGLLGKTYDLLNAKGYLYLSFMSGGTPGFDKASFSDKEMYFNYFSPAKIEKELLNLGYAIISKHFHEYRGKLGQVIQDVIIIVNK
ncbi:MAG: class I SAM-dependent methyltransferase [Firmicutes bacterium]|nr:class I SAM-dependent methyltransferase [Bacillota bacterium]